MDKSLFLESLVLRVAALESHALDIGDILQYMGDDDARQNVSDELQEIAHLSKALAKKLKIIEQVEAVRQVQELNLEARKAAYNMIKTSKN